MGGESSREVIVQRLEQEEDARKRDYEIAKETMAALDSKTRVPHLLIEVRSLGFIEVQGKNTGGIYDKLEEWFVQNWHVARLTTDIVEVANDEQECGCCGYSSSLALGVMQEHNRLCDQSYIFGTLTDGGTVLDNGTYKSRGTEGENNMGKLTMDVVQFMTNECGWTFQMCDSGNLGYRGDIREQQIKFKAPHPLNLIAPHVMIELRQVGYIEINGQNTDGIYESIRRFVRSKWGASETKADPQYCAMKFTTSAFKSRGLEGENNMGQCTMELVDFMVKECKWTMVTCNGGNFGRTGSKREQQLVFRNDEFVQHGTDHIMVEFRTKGYIEVNGIHDAQDLQPILDEYVKETWNCKDYVPYMWESGEKYCDVKYTCPYNFYHLQGLTNNLGKRTIELADFLGQHGWALLLCNGGSITLSPENSPNNIVREQQVKFTRAKKAEKAAAPLLMIELRTEPFSDSPCQWDGLIEICGRDTHNVYESLDRFISEQMDGTRITQQLLHCDRAYTTNKFRLKASELREKGRWDGYMNGESNIGKWTMRLCDFMVDHLGEWDLLVCNSDNLSRSFPHGSGDNRYWNSVTAREMQLVFRFKPEGRTVFMTTDNSKPLGRAPQHPPKYWVDPGCLSGSIGHKLLPGTVEELAWIQELLDVTFKHKVTRDRRDGEELADRFVAVQCVRSEHPELWDRFAIRRQEVADSFTSCPGPEHEYPIPRTMQCSALAKRCCTSGGKNPANQVFLLHGTNPTSATAILGRSFTIDFAGKSAGTMFGPGVYLAESSTKADEYARDDVGGEYDGLYAMLVCRAVLGRAFVTENAGDFKDKVLSGEYGHVLGDRERAVGTFREFVFFHEASIYPEYAVFYHRERDGKVLPPAKCLDPPRMETMHGEVPGEGR